MNSSPRELKIATRESALALWQANFIKAKLQALYPECKIEILGMTTQGDQILDKTLSKIGGKGLFIKELEYSLIEKSADIAVHSMKDVPMNMDSQFCIAAISARATPFDAFISNNYSKLEELSHGSVIGTSSLRREAQIKAKFPHLIIRPLRGNVQTRLNKLDNNEYDAIILAAAGLERLGLQHRIKTILPVEYCLPAVGQGALGLEILSTRTDLLALLKPLNDDTTNRCITAERSVAKALNGSCQIPLAAYCIEYGNELELQALVANPNGNETLHAKYRLNSHDPEKLGRDVANDLIRQGARKIIDSILN